MARWRELASRKQFGQSSRPSTSSGRSPTAPGLVILHGQQNDLADGVKVDIVAIHGLAGHYINTWATDSGVCWPRDLLPNMTSRIGMIRIMTFGYAAGQQGTKLDLDIEDAAWKLIHDLEAIRSSPQRNRPIIFIVHSLGGLVLKKALIISNNALSLRHILWAVEGIVFLATPHQGSALADIADRILRWTPVSGTPRGFIKALRRTSPELSAIADDFRQIVNQRKLPIASFYELYSLKALPCLNPIIVTKDSAVLHIPSEILFGTERDHRTIAKFESETDEVFQRIVGNLEAFMKKGTISSNARVLLPWDSSCHFQGRRDTLQRLYEAFFPTINDLKQNSLRPAHITTTASRRRVAMVFGDGGLGKTEVALKFARENEFHYSFVLFAECTSIQTLDVDIVALHDSLGLPSSFGRELQDLREFLKQEDSWLFILDNDNDFLAMSHLQFQDVDHGHIIITCRQRENITDPRLDAVIQLRALSVKEARDLLYSRAGIHITERVELEEDATALVETLGCVPAMVENTAAYMVAFETDVRSCLKLIGHRRSRHSVLGYHTNSARYKMSAESLFELRIHSLREHMPDAYYLLSTIVWLDRTRTTKSFLLRAGMTCLRWAANGEREERSSMANFIPPEFVDLVTSPEFDIAINNLKHSSLISRDEVFDYAAMGDKESIVIHPSLYQFLRDHASEEQGMQAICPALALVAHAYPILQGGLEKSSLHKRQMNYQVQQCLRDIQEVTIATHDDIHKSLQVCWGPQAGEFAELMAEIFLEAIGSYGDCDESDLELLNMAQVLLQGSDSIYLRARLWCKKLPLEYYKHGRLCEGCMAAEDFLKSLEREVSHLTWSNRDNAEVGILRSLIVEYRPSEPHLTPRQRWKVRADFIDTWHPLDSDSPSTLERYVVGLGVRMCGKLAKDFGQFADAYRGLKEYCEHYADRGSREEGWALGDFAQSVLELEDTEEGSDMLLDLAKNGVNFGEKVVLEEGTLPCDLMAYILSRAVNSRIFERGYLTPDMRQNVRESDIMWLQLIYAFTLLHQGKHIPDQYAVAERELRGLSERFQHIEAAGSWYDEQIRHFEVKCGLAQISHMMQDWVTAQSRWSETIRYARDNIVNWGGSHYYIEVARYSLADAQCSGGLDPREVIPTLGDTLRTLKSREVKWMLGMGTYWLSFVHARMAPRIEALETLAQTNSIEARMAVLSVALDDL